jgi:hypothetical protein
MVNFMLKEFCMKNKLNAFGIIAVIAIIGFSFVACDNGNGNNGYNKPLFSVSGEFKGAGSGNALFKAATTQSAKKSLKSARFGISADSSYELTGELEDGDILFRLKGTYDDATGSYTVSSASSFARYTINGDESGATATLAVKSGDDWTSFVVSVTVKEVSVKDGDAQDYAGGLPSWAQGSWHDWWSQNHSAPTESSFEAWSYFNQWYYEAWRSSVWHDNWEFSSIKYTVIEANKLPNEDIYDVIFSYPVYKGTDAQKKKAFENFFKEIKVPAEFWNKKFNPWDHDAWNGGGDDEGKNYDNSIIWYICMNENHTYHLGARIINWETFEKLFPTKEKQDEFWGAIDYEDDNWWNRKAAIEAFLESKNIKSFYYWGWHEPDFNPDTSHENRAYTCWEPTCEDGGEGGWWDKTHYYLKWGNQTGIQGDWDKYRDLFSKWDSDDYLITYLRSQNVQPETWYTRVRIWKDTDGTFMFYYYNGDKEAETANSHSAPACDTKSLTKIKGLSFDPNYLDWSYNWQPKRTSPR